MLQLLAALQKAGSSPRYMQASGDLKDLWHASLDAGPGEERGQIRARVGHACPTGSDGRSDTGAANELLKMVEHTSAHKEELMQCLEDCNEEYEDAVQQLEPSRVSMDERAYHEVVMFVEAAMSDVKSCEDTAVLQGLFGKFLAPLYKYVTPFFYSPLSSSSNSFLSSFENVVVSHDEPPGEAANQPLHQRRRAPDSLPSSGEGDHETLPATPPPAMPVPIGRRSPMTLLFISSSFSTTVTAPPSPPPAGHGASSAPSLACGLLSIYVPVASAQRWRRRWRAGAQRSAASESVVRSPRPPSSTSRLAAFARSRAMGAARSPIPPFPSSPPGMISLRAFRSGRSLASA
ncbi:hypothetical protein J5N97_000622 [Dioscorea zingiberensis]|uniref:Pectinesterase inhibitor domain-containing protein n=1 Tax=Dioscorea zingiberensis TaxID=325984 RepID=A0A9D5BS84_9LILI|nr:hypothetical protein J5N97_000622 [Dioscorea zingiberensis]